jgi:CRISPR-associated protein (TIGR02710 family)
MPQPHILLCTVGTGSIDQLRETLLEPLKKSIRKGEWTRVVLLPSRLTAGNATLLQEDLRDVPIDVQPLHREGDEDDADACFAHFASVLDQLRAGGVPPEALLVDFTRGTKAMSAALVLAAVRHDLPQLRYISGGRRDERGMVVPGTEIVAEVRTTIATARKRLDDASRFFRHGNFAAVLEILPDAGSSAPPWPADLLPMASFARSLAAFYSTWDRLDYKGAQCVALSDATPRPSGWDAFLPPPEVRDWVASLAQPFPDSPQDRAIRLRQLIADLLANGERRIRDGQYEDAIIRAYRVLELVGQIRLFDRGLDSAALPPDHPVVKQFQDELLKKKSTPLSEGKGGLLAAKDQAGRLLKRLGDPLGQRLLDLGNEGGVKTSQRNLSVWIHGFEVVSGSDPEPLREVYAKLERLIQEDGGAPATGRLRLARWLDFSKS